MGILFAIGLAIAAVLFSCAKEGVYLPATEVSDLPADAGGVQTLHALGTDASPLGYFLYEPAGAQCTTLYPLLIYLHGSGGILDTPDSVAALDKIAHEPVPAMIASKKWNPPYAMIVASPHSGAISWDKTPNPQNLRAFIRFLVEHYPVNPERVYLTGYSMGGYGIYNYLATYGDTSGVAAAVPIAGAGWAGNGKKIRVPIWAFHGDADDVVKLQGDLDMIDSINAHHPKDSAKITVYPGAGHGDVGYPTYDGSGMGTESPDYAPFTESIYTWMARF